MASFWMFFVVVLLCYSTQPQIVLAGKEELGPKALGEWNELPGSQGNVDPWYYRKSELITLIKAGGGVSWFNTPLLNLPTTSYLVIKASCNKNPCRLEINGTSDGISEPTNFEFIQNVTFEKQNIKTIIIKEAYRRLRIIALAASLTRFTIDSVKIYHYFCEKGTKHNTVLNQMDSSTTNISVIVQCGDNAVVSDGNSTNITANCTPKGNWTFGDIKCVCDKGFQSNSKHERCSRCLINYYKSAAGVEECRKCPDGTKNNIKRTKCKCKEEHYTIGDKEDGPCYTVPSKVGNLQVQASTNTSVNITWEKPKNNDGFKGSLTYSVKCYRCISDSKCDTIVKNAIFVPADSLNLKTTYVIVSNLTFNKTYKFKIFSMRSLKNVPSGKWKSEEKTYTLNRTADGSTVTPAITNGTKTTNSEAQGKDDNIFIYIGAGVAFLVIVLLIVLLIITRWRRGKSKKNGKDNLGFERVPLPDIGQKTYIDPSNFHDPEAALKDFVNEIPHKSLTLERVIGGGEFGDVYKGKLKTEGGGVIDVAAKTLKHDSDERSRKDFFMEASAMGQFDDPNVIHLEGVVTKTVPHMIVTEYMSNGSLDNYLKQNDSNLTHLQLVGMARGVASGMKYLAAMNFIHRDLAARNILVNDALLCKVSDFGLSRELENEGGGEYCTTGGKIPVRWTAPESIKYRKFSTASDVWSYGILLWEIMSFAERPYWDWDNFKVLERVDEGYRLPAPKNCPKAVHELMLLCWNTKDQRPDFPDIVKMLDDWIRSPETIRYEKISTIRPVSGAGISDPALQIKEWLNDIKMSSYIPHFTQAGFNQLSDLAGLLDSDLQGIGISLIGHRNKMLRTIRSLSITDQSKKTAWKRAPSLVV